VAPFRSRRSDEAALRPIPRDVESLEKLITDLERAQDLASTWRITVDSTVQSHNFSYGAVWLPDGKGNVRIEYETGPISRELQAVVPGGPVPADVGLVGKAWRTKQFVYLGSMADCVDCLRCQAAGKAGMAAAVVIPVMHRNQQVAVLEYYSAEPLYIARSGRRSPGSLSRPGSPPSPPPSCARSPTTGWR
jgi:hypothetical protein